jgi:anti-sigma factor RsiW
MNCNEIENLLPAYLENLLSPEEKKNIEGHLASCPRCSRAYEALKKTEEIVQDLTEVEPPPFFEQRIMSRVREEAAHKQGILRKLFYPLYIKVPLQAFATLLVAVMAFSIYRTVMPEWKDLTPPAITLTEPAKDQATAESRKAPVAPAAATPVLRTPAADLPERKKQGFAAPPIDNGAKTDQAAGPTPSLQQERAPVAKSAVPAIAARETERLTLRAEALSKAQDKAGRQEADQSFETPPPEPARKGKMAAMGAVPATSQGTDAAAQRPALDLTIHVKDVHIAVRAVEARLDQANGRIIERQRRDAGVFLKAEVAAQNLAVFLDRIEAIGRVKVEKGPRDVPDGIVTVKIEIASEP